VVGLFGGFMDDNVVTLNSYRGKGRNDLRTLIDMRKKIAEIEDRELREFFEEAWCSGAKIASALFHPS
jgi:hypothetical protein